MSICRDRHVPELRHLPVEETYAVGKDKKQVTWNELIMGVGFRLSSLQSLLPHTQGSGGYAIVKMTVIKRDRRTSLPDAAGYLSGWPWKNYRTSESVQG